MGAPMAYAKSLIVGLIVLISAAAINRARARSILRRCPNNIAACATSSGSRPR